MPWNPGAATYGRHETCAILEQSANLYSQQAEVTKSLALNFLP